MNNQGEVTLTLNKREMHVLKIALFFLSQDIRHGSLRPEISDQGDFDTLLLQSNIINLSNIENIENKIKKQRDNNCMKTLTLTTESSLLLEQILETELFKLNFHLSNGHYDEEQDQKELVTKETDTIVNMIKQLQQNKSE